MVKQIRYLDSTMRITPLQLLPKIVFGLALAVVLGNTPDVSAADLKAADPKPNVLFIAADDLNDRLGCLGGHPQASTPNLDRLAHRGTLFVNAHCQAPICNPSPSSLLTGLRPSATGIYALQPGIRAVAALENHVTLPQYFRNHGYFTATSGKIFHDGSLKPEARADEFEHWGSAAGSPYPQEKFVHTPDDIAAMDWGPFPARDDACGDWKIADSAIAHLRQAPSDKPFLIAAGFRLPPPPGMSQRCPPMSNLYQP